MSLLSNHINEAMAAEAFTKQAIVFDGHYENDAIIQYKRQRVRQHILEHAEADGLMLELNCGTGEDALFFAKKGFRIHATDISEGMVKELEHKLVKNEMRHMISTELCSFTELDSLRDRGPFDHIYSNFGGLNCTSELEKVLSPMSPLLKPGGRLTLVIISGFCLWETLLLFRGKFKTAFRRFFSAKGRKARVEGSYFRCWYYRPSFVIKQLKKDFDLLEIEGLCSIVPPSYMAHFAEKHPKLFSFLRRREDKLKSSWPWKYTGDYFIISFRKKIN